MSDRPQTTRNKIMCIMNTDNAQIMFLDTPGIHKPQHKLGQYMVRAAESTLHEVDVVLFVVDVSEKRGAGEDYILEQLRRVKTPVILVANKIDKLADKGKLFGIIESYTKDFAFAAVVPVSALQDTEFPGLVSYHIVGEICRAFRQIPGNLTYQTREFSILQSRNRHYCRGNDS